jgi:hypothetical protein
MGLEDVDEVATANARDVLNVGFTLELPVDFGRGREEDGEVRRCIDRRSSLAPSADGLSGRTVVRPVMKAITVEEERIECDELEEGEHGLVLYHDGRIVGYVPYQQLQCVTETRTPVASSSIRSLGYSGDERELEIEFQSGGIYRYSDVPRETYEGLLGARSHGSYFHENVRGQYDYLRIR